MCTIGIVPLLIDERRDPQERGSLREYPTLIAVIPLNIFKDRCAQDGCKTEIVQGIDIITGKIATHEYPAQSAEKGITTMIEIIALKIKEKDQRRRFTRKETELIDIIAGRIYQHTHGDILIFTRQAIICIIGYAAIDHQPVPALIILYLLIFKPIMLKYLMQIICLSYRTRHLLKIHHFDELYHLFDIKRLRLL